VGDRARDRAGRGDDSAVEYVRFKWNERRTKRPFKSLLQIELPLILDTLDTLVVEHGKQDYFWLLTVALLPVQRQGFDRRRDQIVLFKDERFRQDVILLSAPWHGGRAGVGG
jgi:hypothetical protein